jgi:hypothetical protein
MSTMKSRLWPAACAGCVALTALSLSPEKALGQRTASGEKSVLIVRTTGEADRARRAPVKRATPAPLGVEQIRQMLGPEGLALISTGSFKVTPVAPVSAGSRAVLAFEEMEQFYPAGGLAKIHGAPEGAVLIYVRSLPTQKLFIDCTVEKGTYRISGPGVSQVVENTEHVAAVYYPPSSDYAIFSIERQGPTWEFYSCELTPAQ